jgi:hypothetical protein
MFMPDRPRPVKGGPPDFHEPERAGESILQPSSINPRTIGQYGRPRRWSRPKPPATTLDNRQGFFMFHTVEPTL